jgi:hypothetical protein
MEPEKAALHPESVAELWQTSDRVSDARSPGGIRPIFERTRNILGAVPRCLPRAEAGTPFPMFEVTAPLVVQCLRNDQEGPWQPRHRRIRRTRWMTPPLESGELLQTPASWRCLSRWPTPPSSEAGSGRNSAGNPFGEVGGVGETPRPYPSLTFHRDPQTKKTNNSHTGGTRHDPTREKPRLGDARDVQSIAYSMPTELK